MRLVCIYVSYVASSYVRMFAYYGNLTVVDTIVVITTCCYYAT